MDMTLYLRQRVMEDQDREEARVELEKLKAGLLKIRDQVTPAWFFTDLIRRANFVLDRL